MKKLVVILMMVLSMVAFGKRVVISYGEDNYTGMNDANPVVLVVMNTNTKKYTLLRNTASPHGGTFGIMPGDEIYDSDFKVYIMGFDNKHPDGYNTGLKSLVYLKHKGKTYKEISYETLRKVLYDIGYNEWKD
jgi:hypothetical protein